MGVYIVGLVYFFSSLLSTQTVKWYGRRTLLIGGHIAIVVIHALLAIFNNNGSHMGVLLMVLAFMIVYQNTTGPVTWVYAAETTTDAGLGVCMFMLYTTAFILTLVGPVLMGSNSIGLSNVFFIFSGLSVLGAFYAYFLIKET